ncbi:MAG: hypothetical protein UY83_C0009G0006 [Candidatus Adlerbacteria bacterium GW2011_GWA1_54_10]|uniref:Uncharacterized protein n=1 Tax=Candidatus Adlerbacteria bacterium GW2011_GWA1_54_10 TaxID=1618605 RepID=A0A0G1XVZ8_9BACT|nr:MAG: hypothetical protein UY83_C0009G0006 [Candidatus Adlerbacteria bacterium GW2011_GWA1_54_10]
MKSANEPEKICCTILGCIDMRIRAPDDTYVCGPTCRYGRKKGIESRARPGGLGAQQVGDGNGGPDIQMS